MIMKADELRSLTLEEMTAKIITLKDELFKLRGQIKTGKLEKPARISQIRKDLARIYTIQKERITSNGRTNKKA